MASGKVDEKKLKELNKKENDVQSHLDYLISKNRGIDKSDNVLEKIEKLKKSISVRESMKTLFDSLPIDFLEAEAIDFNDRFVKMKELIAIDSRLKGNIYQIKKAEEEIAMLNAILNDLRSFDEQKLLKKQQELNDLKGQIQAIYAAKREYERQNPRKYYGHCGACTFGGTGHVCGDYNY